MLWTIKIPLLFVFRLIYFYQCTNIPLKYFDRLFLFYIYADKVTYDGQFKDDKKTGFGVYKWPDGRIYIGWWFNGRQHGYGTYTGKEKIEKYGLWEHGKRITWFTES